MDWWEIMYYDVLYVQFTDVIDEYIHKMFDGSRDILSWETVIQYGFLYWLWANDVDVKGTLWTFIYTVYSEYVERNGNFKVKLFSLLFLGCRIVGRVECKVEVAATLKLTMLVGFW